MTVIKVDDVPGLRDFARGGLEDPTGPGGVSISEAVAEDAPNGRTM